jgi:hypothetical protein
MIQISIFWLITFLLFFLFSVYWLSYSFYKLNQKDLSELKNDLRKKIVIELSEDFRQAIFESEKEILKAENKKGQDACSSIKDNSDIKEASSPTPNFFEDL